MADPEAVQIPRNPSPGPCTECGIPTPYVDPHGMVVCPCGAWMLIIGSELRSCVRPAVPAQAAAIALPGHAPPPAPPEGEERPRRAKATFRPDMLTIPVRHAICKLVQDGARQSEVAIAFGMPVYRVRHLTRGLTAVGRKPYGALPMIEIQRRASEAMGTDHPAAMRSARERIIARAAHTAVSGEAPWSPQVQRLVMEDIVKTARPRDLQSPSVKVARTQVNLSHRIELGLDTIRGCLRLALVRAGAYARAQGRDLDDVAERVSKILGLRIEATREGLESKKPLPDEVGPPDRARLGFPWPWGAEPIEAPTADELEPKDGAFAYSKSMDMPDDATPSEDPDDDFADPTTSGANPLAEFDYTSAAESVEVDDNDETAD